MENKREELQVYEYRIRTRYSERDGKKIYGVAYIPYREEKVPLVILSHELCATHESGMNYAEELAAHGVAAYTFDFCGGSVESRSQGETTQMTVLTEVEDLEIVLETVKDWEFADQEKIVLLGCSQGGLVTAIAAAKHREALAGVILLYPAFSIPDILHKSFGSKGNVPEQFKFMDWIMVGKKYAEDMWDYDVYREVAAYDKKVLLLHGNCDYIVDVFYSQKAALEYPDCEMHCLNAAGHIFEGRAFQEAMNYIWNYLDTMKII